jgi:hypothetical protein
MVWSEGEHARVDCLGMGISLICELCHNSEITSAAYPS